MSVILIITSNMEKLSSIFYKSALETYDLVEKNKKPIVQLITMALPKETRDFIFKKEFDYETYYSKSELESMDVKNKRRMKKKRKVKQDIKYRVSLSKSINKPKLHFVRHFIRDHIPEGLLNFLIFFSYLSLHSIYFWSVFIIVLFVTNINYLLIGLCIAFINAIGTIVFSDCPVFILEQKYRNKLTHNQHFMCNIIKKITDDTKHYGYEELLEQLIFVVFVIFIKIKLIILYNCFCK